MAQVNRAEDKSTQKDSSGNSDDDERSAKDQHSYFTCLVCMRTAHIPRVSFCGHHFCAKCIRDWMKTQRSRAKCPYCQSRVGENTLITVRHSRSLERSLSCRTIQEQRRRMLKTGEYVRELAILPEASMFMRGYIEYTPEAMPRIRALPPQMLRQLSSQPTRRKFLDPMLFQRALTYIIMLFLFVMYQNGI